MYRPRSIPNSSPSGAKGVYGHMLSDTCHPAGVQETLDTVFYILVAPLVLRCDLPKPRRGERCIRRTKLTLMVRLGNRTYRPENRTNPVNLVLYQINPICSARSPCLAMLTAIRKLLIPLIWYYYVSIASYNKQHYKVPRPKTIQKKVS